MKGKMMNLAALLVAKVASISAKPLCVFLFHQPKVPSQLINK